MSLLVELTKMIPRGLLMEAAIAADDEKLVKHILTLYKHDPDSQHLKTMVRIFIAAHRASRDKINPELLAIAKSMGIKMKDTKNPRGVIARPKLDEWPGMMSLAAPSMRGFPSDTTVNKVTRRKRRKKVTDIVFTEEMDFTTHGVEFDGDIWVHVMSNHPDDDYYDDYHGNNVIFKADGKIETSNGDAKAEEEWKKYKTEIIHAALRGIHVGDKAEFLKYLLKSIKRGAHRTFIEALIRISRKYGHDYPEFKAIEKSITAN